MRSLILEERIQTTEAKAKTIKGILDKLMTKAREGSLSARRQVLAFLPDKKAVHKLFDDLAKRSKDRTSGFTTTVKIGRRRGDNAMISRIELVDKPLPKEKAKKAAAPKKPAKKVTKK